MEFIELQVRITPEFADILTAELAEIGYEAFVETDQGINAYIVTSQFSESFVQDIVQKYQHIVDIQYAFTVLEKKNWNEEWEKNYPPIVVDNRCLVRASFHTNTRQYPYEIIINPKMSFGTGHHETTALMLENQLMVLHEGKRVLDAGSGTGILAIMAAKRGAVEIDAFDIEEWAVENARENCTLNGFPHIRVQRGTMQEVSLSSSYDMVLANINRNVLLQDIPLYAEHLSEKGFLLVSGFYTTDAADIEEVAKQHSLTKIDQKSKNNWTALVFQRIN